MKPTYRKFLTALVGASCTVFLGGSAHATLNTTAFVYHGGPVLQPDIIPVYWGNFTSTQITQTQTYLNNLASYISGAMSQQGKEPTVAQYGVHSAMVEAAYTDTKLPPQGRTAANGTGTCSDSTGPTGPCAGVVTGKGYYTFEQEITRLQSAQTCSPTGGACSNPLPPYGTERVFLVLTTGILIPDMGNGICMADRTAGSGQYFVAASIDNPSCGDGVQAVLSHEILETATNANKNGWNGTPPNGANGGELSDGCGGTYVDFSWGRVEGIWDLTQNATCQVWTPEQAAPITALATQNTLDVLAWNSDENVSNIQYKNGAWTKYLMSPGHPAMSPPVGYAGTSSDSVDVFIQGTDLNIYHQSSTDGTQWATGVWTDNLGGPCMGQPVVSSSSAGKLDVFCLGNNGIYYTKESTATGWPASWTAIGSATFNGPPAVVPCSYGGNSLKLDIVGWGTDGLFHHTRWPGTGSWDVPMPGSEFMGNPMVTCSSGLDIFGQGTDWKYYHGTESGGLDTNLGGPYIGPPVALYQTSASDLSLVGQGTDYNYYESNRFGGQWFGNGYFGGTGIGAGTMANFGSLGWFLIEGSDNHLYYKTATQGETWSPSRSFFNGSGIGGLH